MSVWLDPLRETRPIALDRQPAGWGEYLGTVGGEMLAETTRTIGEQTARNQAEIEARAFGGPELTGIFGAENVAAPLVPREQVNERVKRLGLSFDQPMTEFSLQSITRAREQQLENEFIYRRAREGGDYGTAKWLAAGALELLLSATDPTNIASAFIPAMGPARFAQLVGRIGTTRARLVAGTLEGAFGALAVEPIYGTAKSQTDPDYGLADSLINVAFGGVIGGGLHWLGGRFVDALDSRREARATRELAGILRTESTTPMADVPQRMAEALERLKPETREAALRSALAQLGDDRRVDIDTIVRSDREWKPPRITAEERRLLLSPERAEGIELEAAAREIVERAREALRGVFRPSPVPESFAPTPQQMAEARRMVRGLPAVAEGRGGMSLSQYVRARGGIDIASREGGELLAQNLGPLSGLLTTRRTQGASNLSTSGHSADDLALWATEEGFYPRERGRADMQQFITDLIEDAQGYRKLYSEFDEDAVRAADARTYNASMVKWLGEQRLDVRGMEARELAWLLSLDTSRQRREILTRRVDRLTESETVEALDIVDRDIADAVAADEAAFAELTAARREGFDAELEADPELAQRARTERPVTLADLERLNATADQSAIDRARRGDQGSPGEPLDAGERAGAPGERAGVDQPADQAAAEAAGLRSEDGGRRAGRPERAESDTGSVQTRLTADRPTTDAGPDGGAQTVIAGAERINDRELAERRMRGSLRGGDAPPPAGGLFDADARAQSDLFDAPRPLAADDIEAHIGRQTSPESDLHADFEAQRRAEAEAGTKPATPEEELQAFLDRYGDQLSDGERAELEAVAKSFDDEAKAIEALARCQIGGVDGQ